MIWTLEFRAPNLYNAHLHAQESGLTAGHGGRLGFEATGPYEAVVALKNSLIKQREEDEYRAALAAARDAYTASGRTEADHNARGTAIAAAEKGREAAIRRNYILTRHA